MENLKCSPLLDGSTHSFLYFFTVESVSTLKIAKVEAVQVWGHNPKIGSLELATYLLMPVGVVWLTLLPSWEYNFQHYLFTRIVGDHQQWQAY